MTTAMRVMLIAGSVLTSLYVLVRIRRNKMQTENSLFWIFFSLILVLLGIFPQIAHWAANLLGVISTVNLVYLIIIFLLVVKIFLQDQRLAKVESQVTKMAQTYAIDHEEEKEGGSC